MNTIERQEEKAPCSKDSEAEDGAHLRTPIAVRKAQGIQKITLKAKIVKEGTGSLNYEEKSPVSKMMHYPNLGDVPRLNPFTSQIRHFEFLKTRMQVHVKLTTSEDLDDHWKIFQASSKKREVGPCQHGLSHVLISTSPEKRPGCVLIKSQAAFLAHFPSLRIDKIGSLHLGHDDSSLFGLYHRDEKDRYIAGHSRATKLHTSRIGIKQRKNVITTVMMTGKGDV
ncbi:hypothetical protein Tco_1235394 [Tanacetum coccineum]